MAEAAWLNKREERAWRGLLAMHAQLGAELARRLAAESPLSYQDYEVLVALTDGRDSRLRVFSSLRYSAGRRAAPRTTSPA